MITWYEYAIKRIEANRYIHSNLKNTKRFPRVNYIPQSVINDLLKENKIKVKSFCNGGVYYGK